MTLKFNGIKNSNNLLLKLFSMYLSNLFVVLCVIVAISLLLFSSITIECDVLGISMQPTLNRHGGEKSDVVYVNVDNHNYNYGDIIVIDTDQEAIIKRVVGLPGDILDIVRCEDGFFRLVRNGEIIYEDYIKIDSSINLETYFQNGMNETLYHFQNLKRDKPWLFNNDGKLVVGEDSLFALGDNRRYSQDSSYYGTFKYSQIRGVVEEIRYYGESELNFYLNYVGSGDFFDIMIYILCE